MFKRLQAMKAKKGFTLVELIVVIVIIAILAAILIPILVNHVANSRRSQTAADAKTAHNLAAEKIVDNIAQGVTATTGAYAAAAGTVNSGTLVVQYSPSTNGVRTSLTRGSIERMFPCGCVDGASSTGCFAKADKCVSYATSSASDWAALS